MVSLFFFGASFLLNSFLSRCQSSEFPFIELYIFWVPFNIYLSRPFKMIFISNHFFEIPYFSKVWNCHFGIFYFSFKESLFEHFFCGLSYLVELFLDLFIPRIVIILFQSFIFRNSFSTLYCCFLSRNFFIIFFFFGAIFFLSFV